MKRRIVITALLAGTAVLAGCKKTPPASLPRRPRSVRAACWRCGPRPRTRPSRGAFRKRASMSTR